MEEIIKSDQKFNVRQDICRTNEEVYEIEGKFNEAKNVFVPNFYDQKKIISVGFLSFSGSEEVELVKISDSIREIKEAAFKDCYNLKEVILPENLKVINDDSFFNCRSLTTIKFPINLTHIGKRSFYNNISLEEITLGGHISSIDDFAFTNCINLKKIYFSEEINFIGQHVFANLDSLKMLDVHQKNLKLIYNVFKDKIKNAYFNLNNNRVILSTYDIIEKGSKLYQLDNSTLNDYLSNDLDPFDVLFKKENLLIINDYLKQVDKIESKIVNKRSRKMNQTPEEIEKILIQVLDEVNRLNKEKDNLLEKLRLADTLDERIRIEKALTRNIKEFDNVVDAVSKLRENLNN